MNLSEKLNAILKDYSSGNKELAYKKFKKIYFQNKGDTKLRFNLAVMQQELGLLNEAELNYISLIENNESSESGEVSKYKINLYNLYITKGFYQNALKIINSIKLTNYSLISVNQDRAYILYLLKDYKDSIKECNEILKIDNKNSNALNTLGLCLFNLQKYDQANTTLLKALGFDKNNVKILNSLGRLNHEIRKSKDAEIYFNKAFNLSPNTFETLNNMAGFYLEEGNYQKAINFYKKAEALRPKNAILLNNIAKTFICIDQINDAEKYCKKAILIDKKNDDFKKTLSLIFLKKYDFKNAWSYFDGRLGLSSFKGKNQNLNLVINKIPKKNYIDKTSKILIIREQGIGDEILYGTMYFDLLKEFSDVIIECDERIIPLFKNSFKDNENKFVKLGTYSSNLEKINNFDYVIYAGSLGKYFRNSLNSFSQKPYLKNIINYKDLELKNILYKVNRLKIGISWKSFQNRYASEKSLSLEDFKNIIELENSTIFNLQYGNVKDELEFFINKKNLKIITLKKLDLFNNLSGLANLLTKLDIFVTVSNSTAHLASALGVKTILIKPPNHASFHYWNYEDGKTPWYKSVNIISKKDLKNKELLKKLIKS